MLELSKVHRVNFFLIKFKDDLKQQILDIDNVSKTRKKILAAAIMQKRILERTRVDNENENFENSESHSFKKDSKSHKNDFESSESDFEDFKKDSERNELDNKRQSNHESHESSSHRESRHNNSHSFDHQTNNHTVKHFNLKNVICFHCQRKKHYFIDCFHKNRLAIKTQVKTVNFKDSEKSKNDEASQSSRKRSRKEK